MDNSTNTAKEFTVNMARLSVVDLVINLTDCGYDRKEIHSMIDMSKDKGFNGGDFLISYDRGDNLFIVIVTNEEFNKIIENK